MTSGYTRVALYASTVRLHVYLRFGRPARWQVVDELRRHAFFAPEGVFCRVWWEAGAYGTERWQLCVLQALPRDRAMQRIAGIEPGARILLNALGASKVRRILRLIRHIEARALCPADVAPSYWQVVHNRLSARAQVTIYGRRRHGAELARRSIR